MKARWDTSPVAAAPLPVPAGQAQWLQINLALVTVDGSWNPAFRAVMTDLTRQLPRWRRRAPVDWWLIRKVPGVRLRLTGLDRAACSELVGLLDGQVTQGHLHRWWFSTYEPETARLGGPVLLPAVHRLLCADSQLWADWDALAHQGHTRLSRDLLALALAGDLIERGCEEPAESWAVWYALHRYYAPQEAVPGPGEPRPQLRPQGLLKLTGEAERQLLERGFAANQRFGEALHQTWLQGQLLGGRRALLASLTAFHWNIWCLSLPAIVPLCRAMVRELHPAGRFTFPEAVAEAS